MYKTSSWNQRSLLSQKQGGCQAIDDSLPRCRITWATRWCIWFFRPDVRNRGGCQVCFLSSHAERDKGPRALNQNNARTICIVFVNRDIYRWNQRSLLSQKQIFFLRSVPTIPQLIRNAFTSVASIHNWTELAGPLSTLLLQVEQTWLKKFIAKEDHNINFQSCHTSNRNR
ncbi:hypothetical protein PROFUN_04353 [Planoprotostelium fungivorum]|uniref:Uncharacterized protein n=1 Tax=Planoprotostelium fungivorum TaxID=1890364 RepID=A0A2P6NHR4_9EUKA|nr:hypothetical protein PROFUN_04353 [Planoprotostelium fungivorum]